MQSKQAHISKPFIRGLGYNRVLTLYDGIRQEGQQWGDEHGIEVDSYHMERAEIIKGPASLMYGSDAVAGVVSLFPFVHRAKDGRLHGKFISEYQSNNHLMGYGLRLGYGRIIGSRTYRDPSGSLEIIPTNRSNRLQHGFFGEECFGLCGVFQQQRRLPVEPYLVR